MNKCRPVLRSSAATNAVLALLFFCFASCTTPEPKPPRADLEDLPRLRGFNLQAKYALEWSNKPFKEKDFRMISELGFNFVRLPMDYRIWIVDGDWREFDENVLREIDEAIAWGGKYDIHICLNFHRAPGYTVASPSEPTSLWEDRETQEVFAEHWQMFARRYRDIPSQRLSFNPVNEPAGIDAETYRDVMEMAAEAIRSEDPERLIIGDGLDHGRKPVAELADTVPVQATRGYEPFKLTHYKAPWVGGSDRMETPAWPVGTANGYLYGPGRSELHHPMIVRGPFDEPAQMRLRINKVSDYAHLIIKADGSTLIEKHLNPGEEEETPENVVFKEEWEIYQGVYDRDYHVTIPAGTGEITIELKDGDWLSLSEIALDGKTEKEHLLSLSEQWGRRPPQLQYRPETPENPFSVADIRDRNWLWRETISPWQEAEREGMAVLVGEWGAYNHTPHDVMLAWAEDSLKNWQKAGWGWALWNFRGPFGILDSERDDVEYEDFRGHQLDRKLLELLQRY